MLEDILDAANIQSAHAILTERSPVLIIEIEKVVLRWLLHQEIVKIDGRYVQQYNLRIGKNGFSLIFGRMLGKRLILLHIKLNFC